MTTGWAILVAPVDLIHLGKLRLEPTVEVWTGEATNGSDALWIRGSDTSLISADQLGTLPVQARFLVDQTGLATPFGQRVPERRLPDPESPRWRPLAQWWALRAQPALLPGELPLESPVSLELVPATSEKEVGAVLTDAASWEKYAGICARHRLGPLQFAADDRGRVLVRGTPVPSLPGECYTLSHGIALPAGLEFRHPVPLELLSGLLGLAPGSVALFNRNAEYERIDAANFLNATRSAARLTAGQFFSRPQPDED